MNLHGFVASAIGSINPQIAITILCSTGYTTMPDSKRTPTYAPPLQIFAQVQELTSDDLRRVDGLNIQGESRAVYLNGSAAGVVRSEGRGGDLMQFYGKTWLVTKVVERWPDWCKVIVTLQVDNGK